MVGTRKRIYGLLGLCVLLLCGCDEKLTSLTAEEEDIVAMYAAKVVAKHNVRLGQGVMRYRGKIEEEASEEEEEQVEDIEEPAVSAASSDTESGDPVAEDAAGTAEPASSAYGDAEPADDSIPQVELSDALGIEGVQFVYQGVQVPKSLRLSSYYTLPDPKPGKKYVVASYDAANSTDRSVSVSVAALRPSFSASLNGETANAGMVLDHDLVTYEGTLEPGGSERLILLFEFSEAAASDLSDFNLQVSVDGQKSRLIL